ncbi:hypothetical protein K0M31_011977 [Melipona bicolor]|uniref:Uncharacterized protein n=1 Tax=Melipona bicolor TaxID=60889 RepID=A0AA40KVE3_9HYME|nr:hypothetical protein K0M31_011977 [Melipona bicolor]
MDLLADRAMPVTLVLRIPLSCPADSPNITVLERVLSYSGSPLTEYEVGSPFDIESSANFPLRECLSTPTPQAWNQTETASLVFQPSRARAFLDGGRRDRLGTIRDRVG